MQLSSRTIFVACAVLVGLAVGASTLGAQPRPAPDSLTARALAFLPPNNPIRPESALVYARQALSARPTALAHALVADAWGWIYTRTPRDSAARDSARHHLAAALAADSAEAHALYVQGMLQGLAGDTAAMLASYERTLVRDPDHEMAGGNLVWTLDLVGRTSEALALGARYLERPHRNRRLMFRYGWVLGFLWEDQRAEAVFTRLVAMDPDGIYGAWGYGEIAYMRRARGDAAGAIAAMEAAVRARPTDGISRVGLAHMLLNAGDHARAIPMLERELQADPAARGYGSMPGTLLLGWGYLQRGDSAAARRVLDPFERTLRSASGMGAGSPLGSSNLVELLTIEGRLDEAATLALRAPMPRLYGGPVLHDHLRSPLLADARYADLIGTARAQTNARRRAVGLPAR